MSRSKPECPNCKRLERELASLRARLAVLEELLGQNTSNSSRPPSSFPKSKKVKGDKRKAGARGRKSGPKRRRGAQPGHEDQQRKLIAAERVNETVECKPSACGSCGSALSGDDPAPRRVQKVELPPIRPHVTEYRLHRLGCACGAHTTGSTPVGVHPATFGPCIQAITSMLSGRFRLSKRETVDMMAELFNVEMSVGSVCNLERATSEAVAAPVAAAHDYVQKQPHVHADETGWREAKDTAWLWTAVTPLVQVFLIRKNRGAKVARELLGEKFGGVASCDRWVAYSWLDHKLRQLCWAHLDRNFQKLVDRGGSSAKIGHTLLACSARLFEYHHRARDGTLAWSTFVRYGREIRDEVFATLIAGAGCRTKKTARFCKRLFEDHEAMWTFLDHPGLPLTNNAAERAIRKPVLWRKGSFGTDSQAGSRFVERILSVVGTLRVQERGILDYLVEACTAARRGRTPPSLLPDA